MYVCLQFVESATTTGYMETAIQFADPDQGHVVLRCGGRVNTNSSKKKQVMNAAHHGGEKPGRTHKGARPH